MSEKPSINPAFWSAGTTTVPNEPEIVPIGANRILIPNGAKIRIILGAPTHDPFLLSSNYPELQKKIITIPIEGTLKNIKQSLENSLGGSSENASVILCGAAGTNYSHRISGNQISGVASIYKTVVQMLNKADAKNMLEITPKAENSPQP